MIVFSTDSRGHGLSHYIATNNSLQGEEFTVNNRSGKTLREAQKEIRELNNKTNKPDLQILFVGICSLTERDPYSGQISYDGSTLEDTLACIDELYTEFGGRVIVPTIIPANILKYNTGRKGQSSEQNQLEADLQVLNERILELNRHTGVVSIQTHKYVCGGKKRRNREREYIFTPAGLHDGVHPNLNLQNKIYSHICSTAVTFRQQLLDQEEAREYSTEDEGDDPLELLNLSQTSEEEEDPLDTGNFKRVTRK